MATPHPEAVLTEKISQLRSRVRLLVTQRWIIRALVVATGCCALVALGLRLAAVPLPVEWLPAVLAAAIVGGAAIGWTRRVSALDAAQLADRRMELRERLSSGIEFLRQPA